MMVVECWNGGASGGMVVIVVKWLYRKVEW